MDDPAEAVRKIEEFYFEGKTARTVDFRVFGKVS